MRRHEQDRGMHAVARVREVRERDSRVGLLEALTNVRLREARLHELEAALAAAAAREASTLDDFVLDRHLLEAMAHAVHDARARLEAGRVVATEAHARWQADKSRVRAIEHLLEQRALRRAEEADRAEAREVDDIVGRLHARADAFRATTPRPRGAAS